MCTYKCIKVNRLNLVTIIWLMALWLLLLIMHGACKQEWKWFLISCTFEYTCNHCICFEAPAYCFVLTYCKYWVVQCTIHRWNPVQLCIYCRTCTLNAHSYRLRTYSWWSSYVWIILSFVQFSRHNHQHQLRIASKGHVMAAIIKHFYLGLWAYMAIIWMNE